MQAVCKCSLQSLQCANGPSHERCTAKFSVGAVAVQELEMYNAKLSELEEKVHQAMAHG